MLARPFSTRVRPPVREFGIPLLQNLTLLASAAGQKALLNGRPEAPLVRRNKSNGASPEASVGRDNRHRRHRRRRHDRHLEAVLRVDAPH